MRITFDKGVLKIEVLPQHLPNTSLTPHSTPQCRKRQEPLLLGYFINSSNCSTKAADVKCGMSEKSK